MANYEKGINMFLRGYRNRKMLLGIVSEEEGIMCRCSVMSYFLWEGELVNPHKKDTCNWLNKLLGGFLFDADMK